MSEIKVNSVVDASGGNTTTINGYTPTASNMTGRNRVINGDMRINQRDLGTVTPTGSIKVLDRWGVYMTQASKFSVEQSNEAPPGFYYSQKITSTSAYPLLSGDYFLIGQAIEGYNSADFKFRTSEAMDVTLSFWVRSSLTGTFGGSFSNNLNNRSYPFTYTISSANTWEYKTITIPGDTTGTWSITNEAGLKVWFGLGVGSTYSGTAGAWIGSAAFSATGGTSVVGTSGATFYLTGVQLEKGSVATPFEHRHYGTELALCQRYYWKEPGTIYGCQYAGSYGFVIVNLPNTMRTTPVLGYSAVATTTGLAAYPRASVAAYLMTSTSAYVTGLTADAEL